MSATRRARGTRRGKSGSFPPFRGTSPRPDGMNGCRPTMGKVIAMPARRSKAAARTKSATRKKATARKKTAARRKPAAKKVTTRKKAATRKATAKKATPRVSSRVASQPEMTPARRAATPSGRTEMPSRASRPTMPAEPGDFILIDSPQVGSPPREGEVLEVIQGKVSVSYRVQWSDGHQTLIEPRGGTARIVRASERA